MEEDTKDLSKQTQASASSRLWYLVFMPNTGKIPWYQRMAIRNHADTFGHVMMISPLTDTHIQVVEPNVDFVNIELRELDTTWMVEMLRLSKMYPVLEWIAKPDGTHNPTLVIPSCVTAVKAVLGLKSWAVTPKGLHDYMLKNGAEVITVRKHGVLYDV